MQADHFGLMKTEGSNDRIDSNFGSKNEKERLYGGCDWEQINYQGPKLQFGPFMCFIKVVLDQFCTCFLVIFVVGSPNYKHESLRASQEVITGSKMDYCFRLFVKQPN